MGERKAAIPVFLLVQTAAYGSFLYLDAIGEGTGATAIKYLSILLCLLFTLFSAAGGGDRVVAGAMALTLGADTFLLLLNRDYGAGVLLFCLVQGLYLARILRENGGRGHWTVRLLLTVGALALLAALGILTPLNALALAYFSNFLCNTIQSWALPGRRLRLFSLGLTLFLCCDICVGVFNSPGIAPGWLERFSGIGMWLFYLPGQVLIALSALPDAVLRGHDYENQ